jgi:hypothetical protein
MANWLTELWEQLEAIAGIAAAFFIGYLPPVVFIFLSLAACEQRQWGWSVLAVLGLVVTLVLAVRVTRLAGAALYERYPQFRPRPREEAGSVTGSTGDTSFNCGRELEDESLSEVAEALEAKLLSICDKLDAIDGSPPRPVALLIADRLCNEPIVLRPFLSLWWLGHFVAGAFIGIGASRVAIDFLKNPALAFMIILPLAFQFAFLFAVNLYLVMAVAVVCHDHRVHELIWRSRFVIDFLLSLGLTLWAM